MVDEASVHRNLAGVPLSPQYEHVLIDKLALCDSDHVTGLVLKCLAKLIQDHVSHEQVRDVVSTERAIYALCRAARSAHSDETFVVWMRIVYFATCNDQAANRRAWATHPKMVETFLLVADRGGVGASLGWEMAVSELMKCEEGVAVFVKHGDAFEKALGQCEARYNCPLCWSIREVLEKARNKKLFDAVVAVRAAHQSHCGAHRGFAI